MATTSYYYLRDAKKISPANICKLSIVTPAFKIRSFICCPARSRLTACYGSCIIFSPAVAGITQLEGCHNGTYSTWRPTLIAVVVVTHCQLRLYSLSATFSFMRYLYQRIYVILFS